jgi:CubicO group peptidase (beta-lactamase class C family)
MSRITTAAPWLFLATALSSITLVAGCAHTPTQSVTPDLAIQAVVSPESVGFDAAGLRAMDAAMAKVVADGEVAGLSTLLVRHGKVVAFNTYGKASLANNVPMAKDTIHRIYSMTKPITGVAMMMLYEEGKWNLDDPVSKFLPELANLTVTTGVDATGKMITVPAKRTPTMREVMSHTAGFGYGLAPNNPVDDMFRSKLVLGSPNLSEMVTRTASIPLKYQPGEDWSYSISVDLQGRIVEVLSGQTLGAFFESRIFKPLKMTDTAFTVTPEKASRFSDVFAYNLQARRLIQLTPAIAPQMSTFMNPATMQSGGGGLVSTSGDYGRFAQMILNQGQLDGVRLLKPETVALMGQNAIPSGINADNGLIKSFGTSPFSFNRGTGFGLDFLVVTDPQAAGVKVGKGTLSWGGAAGTWFWVDPANDLYFVGMIQRMGGSQGVTDLSLISRTLTYDALTNRQR